MDYCRIEYIGQTEKTILSIEQVKNDPTRVKNISICHREGGECFSTLDGVIYTGECRDIFGADRLVIPVFDGWDEGARLEVIMNTPVLPRQLTDRPPYFKKELCLSGSGAGELSFKLDYDSVGIGVNFPSKRDIVSIELRVLPKEGFEPKPLLFGELRLVYPVTRVAGKMPSDSDFEVLRRRMAKIYCGDPEEYELDLPEYRARLADIDRECASAYEGFKSTYDGTEGSAYGIVLENKLWEEGKVTSIARKIASMAKGYGARGSSFYRDAELLRTIITALDYFNEYYYGPSVWEKGVFGNWWTWQIGVNLYFCPALLILAPELTEEQINRYLAPVDFLVPEPTMTACNRIWLANAAITSALLKKDAKKLLICRDSLLEIFEYVDKSDGPYADGSFIQHGNLAYTGGYGLNLIGEISKLLFALQPTVFAFCDPVVENHYRWIFENYIPVTYKGKFFNATCGREVSRRSTEVSKFKLLLITFLTVSEYAPEDIARRIRGFIRYSLSAVKSGISSSVNLPFIAPLLRIAEGEINEDYITEYVQPDTTRVFGRMDRVARYGEGYGACVSMSSPRIGKHEPMNLQNMDGWYQGDGVLYVYQGGSPEAERYDHGCDFYSFVNPYRLPGITLNSVKRPYAICYCRAEDDFAGGVEGGRFGCAAFRLSYKPWEKGFAEDIRANKSYFFFDREILCLGSDISDSSGTRTLTVMESRVLTNYATKYGISKVKSRELIDEGRALGDKPLPEEASLECKQEFTINSEKFIPSLENTPITPKTVANLKDGEPVRITVEGAGGYIIPEIDGHRQSLDIGLRHNVNLFLEMTLSHGVDPEGGKYFYTLLPGADTDATESYSAAMQSGDGSAARLVKLTDRVHAVAKTVDGVCYLGASFFDEGRIRRGEIASSALGHKSEGQSENNHISLEQDTAIALSAPNPCTTFLSCERKEGKTVVTVNLSDPTHLRKFAVLYINPAALFGDMLSPCASLRSVEQSDRAYQSPTLTHAETLPGKGAVTVKLPGYGWDITSANLASSPEALRPTPELSTVAASAENERHTGRHDTPASAVSVTASQRLQLIFDLDFNIGDTKTLRLVYED